MYIKKCCVSGTTHSMKRNAEMLDGRSVSDVYQARLPLLVAPYLYANIIGGTNKKSYIPEDSELKWIYKTLIKVEAQML